MEKGITDLSDLAPISGDIYLWQGDITTLRCDAIVNAANSEMPGCFFPCHGCMDNAIHTFSGVQLRLECAEIMQKQGCSEPVGKSYSDLLKLVSDKDYFVLTTNVCFLCIQVAD